MMFVLLSQRASVCSHNTQTPAPCSRSICWILRRCCGGIKGGISPRDNRAIAAKSELHAWIIKAYDMIFLNLLKYSTAFLQHTALKCSRPATFIISVKRRRLIAKEPTWVNENCNFVHKRVCFAVSRNSREDIVDTDDAVRPGRAAVVDDRGVTLDPDPAPLLREETVILCGDLAFYQHWRG